jgi:hypothetical protein
VVDVQPPQQTES